MTLKEMREIDIMDIDRESVVEASAIHVDMDLPKTERMLDVVNQMNGNPYFLRSGGTLVKIGYADTAVTLDERMESHLRTI